MLVNKHKLETIDELATDDEAEDIAIHKYELKERKAKKALDLDDIDMQINSISAASSILVDTKDCVGVNLVSERERRAIELFISKPLTG